MHKSSVQSKTGKSEIRRDIQIPVICSLRTGHIVRTHSYLWWLVQLPVGGLPIHMLCLPCLPLGCSRPSDQCFPAPWSALFRSNEQDGNLWAFQPFYRFVNNRACASVFHIWESEALVVITIVCVGQTKPGCINL